MFGRARQTVGPAGKRVERLQVRLGKLVQFKCPARTFTQPAFYAPGVEPPVHLEPVGGQSGVQSVPHVAIFRDTICVADRAELGNVEKGIAANQRIISPGNMVETLVPNHLPLSAFERKTDTGVAPVRVDAHHVGTVLWMRPVRQHIKSWEPENEADQIGLNECAQDNSAVVDGCNEQVGRNYFCLAARPDEALEHFGSGHISGGFE